MPITSFGDAVTNTYYSGSGSVQKTITNTTPSGTAAPTTGQLWPRVTQK